MQMDKITTIQLVQVLCVEETEMNELRHQAILVTF